MKSNKFKLISSMLCGILLLTALAGCAQPEETPAPETAPVPQTVTIVDGFGREVTVTKPIKTVASGLCMVTELLMVLGVEDRIVGIDRTTAASTFLFHDLLSLPLVQTAEEHYIIDYERMIEVDPDVFITGVVPVEGFDDIVATLAPEIPVIAISYDTPEQIVASVRLLGEVFDCQEAADEYIAFFQGTMDTITERVAGIEEEGKPKVYYEMLPYFTFSKDTPTYHNQIAIPGGVNIAADMESAYGMIDPEWVIEQNPDIIVSMAMDYSMMGSEAVACGYEVDDYSRMEALRESILKRSELSEVAAIKEGRVYIIRYDLTVTSCIGFAYMAKWLHPELFEDLDPRAIHQEWLTHFMGIDYDLDEHGVFFYPEL
jgi:iron complex transport system substrate-binding protein